jgi:hypothetical protein
VSFRRVEFGESSKIGARGKRKEGGRVRGGVPKRSDSSKMEGLSSPEKASKKGLETEKLEGGGGGCKRV